MTEAEWLACNDPMPMLKFLRGRTGRRKPLLFLCACYRHVWHLSAAKEATKRKLTEAVEQYVDGRASREQVVASQQAVARAEERSGFPLLSTTAWEAWVAEDCPWEEVGAGAWRTRYRLACDLGEQARPKVDSWKAQSQAHRAWSSAEVRERGRQADLLREIFGSLTFRPSPPLPPAILAWNTGTVAKLAQAIYGERAFDRLPILADALEDAGCHDAAILAHCRGPGPHVRGCWCLDVLLGKT
jgi:hypothetical protein